MTPETYLRVAVTPALSLLPPAMDSTNARRMLLAIALQESSLEHRRQVRGPARSYLQFELGGLRGVLRHDATQQLAAGVVNALDYSDLSPSDLHAALEHNDPLAAAMGRLLLYTHPRALPDMEEAGWEYYFWLWRPGKPHPERWPACWERAGEAI